MKWPAIVRACWSIPRELLRMGQSAREELLVRRDPVRYARELGVQLGQGCRLAGIRRGVFGSEPYLVSLGDHVTISGDVRFITHDGGVWVLRDRDPTIDVVAPIRVGSNVFIGLNAILLPGVTIGDNCVIAAGSVVSRDIPSGSVAAGVPARVIKTVDEYYTSAQRRSAGTKGLEPESKRQKLLAQFPYPETYARSA